MGNSKDIIARADEILRDVKPHGRLPERVIAFIVAKLQFPGVFPSVGAEKHINEEGIDKKDWIELKVAFQFSELMLGDYTDGETVPETVLKVMAEHVVNEVTDLIANGDTNIDEDEDTLLFLMDGLKKRREWPDGYAISDKMLIEASRDMYKAVLDVELTTYLRVIEGLTVTAEPTADPSP